MSLRFCAKTGLPKMSKQTQANANRLDIQQRPAQTLAPDLTLREPATAISDRGHSLELLGELESI
jgi:hypothetical protein